MPSLVSEVDFQVFVIIFPIPFIDFAQDTAGISQRDHIGGYILGHDASRTDHGIVSDMAAPA